ncbi:MULTISPECIES: RsmB/NOP family class I SAM-dependent RNA methyltransferase [unclassified Sphingomonas]|jgi:16S rRNA (cytosine967-C5)-methyltransferase|uniref:RsmB/NOP family class I SAM-dependent RNA methyltransferase n=1 Tax=unclassified Sphingomonas TaxID=196159 RepID=UPI000E1052BF|nr:MULTISPECIES: RsmB/NOP family class I SAM-dependent RNA methyltransferase [unclassified Sphingomonas]AXJ96567.1 RsmB/NOP family class I SAM-dependent RNA methyltransferase [Sphingomonas sp. FARSPH]
MTPAARSQAAIDILDAVIDAARGGGAAADTIVARYFATRRYAGSKDRRAVRELVYAAIRRAGEIPASGRAALIGLAADDDAIAATFDGSDRGPAVIDPGEPVAAAGAMPAWLGAALAVSGVTASDQAALVGRAPLDVRVNRLKADVAEIAAQTGGEAIPGLPDALRLSAGTNVEPLAGAVEVQDAGSQIVSLAARAMPGQRIVDLCAGGGGKTLALAAAMDNRGELIATDVDRARLSRLAPRAEKAGVTIAQPVLLDAGREAAVLSAWEGSADTVLVDAPCSGTGTWRRNPEARWRLTPQRLDRFVQQQRHVMGLAAPLVRPGGALVYIVCSLLDAEGAAQVEAFLQHFPDWRAEPLSLPAGQPRGQGLRLDPAHDGTDGFFVARLIRLC